MMSSSPGTGVSAENRSGNVRARLQNLRRNGVFSLNIVVSLICTTLHLSSSALLITGVEARLQHKVLRKMNDPAQAQESSTQEINPCVNRLKRQLVAGCMRAAKCGKFVGWNYWTDWRMLAGFGTPALGAYVLGCESYERYISIEAGQRPARSLLSLQV